MLCFVVVVILFLLLFCCSLLVNLKNSKVLVGFTCLHLQQIIYILNAVADLFRKDRAIHVTVSNHINFSTVNQCLTKKGGRTIIV